MNRLNVFYKNEGIGDLAFALVVLAALFSTFSHVSEISTLWMITIILLGIVYIGIGVYGYAYISNRNNLWEKMVYFILQIVIGNAILFWGGATGFNAMILLPLVGQSAVILEENWRFFINGLVAVSYTLVLRGYSGNWDSVLTNLPLFIAAQIFVLIFVRMAVSEDQAKREIQQLAEHLTEANQQLRQYAAQVEELAIERERNRVAREIHDGIGHHLTALNMQIKAAQAVLPTDSQRCMELLQNAEKITQRALLDVRQSVAAIRENPSDTPSVLNQIPKIIKEAQTAGLITQFKLVGHPRNLPPEMNLTLLRVVQESISNTLKHAQATTYTFLIDFTNEHEILVKAWDDGIGSEDIRGGFGLVGMRERVNLLDGMFQIHSERGKGFEIEIRLPG
ncbi:signal transduction histidine kinase [Anaerolinea thermolimosa]|uniref:sensor histidine kinase n=1 Tax=Anaerolinea thermolimosa TaxID=229919 RepID=UPI000784074B|nr:sensor histidine kinase [Anaerolinea thermolimosa]GAP06462.1 signal transduction histidine kinase [Anaerolinea thermolimosa]